MESSLAEIQVPQFRRLINEAGWKALTPEDQGWDMRERIEKDGVIFSAYRFPRGDGRYGEVALQSSPSQPSVVFKLTAKDLADRLNFSDKADDMFLAFNEKLQTIRTHLGSDNFASELIQARRKQSKESDRSMLRTAWRMRSEIGFRGFLRIALKMLSARPG